MMISQRSRLFILASLIATSIPVGYALAQDDATATGDAATAAVSMDDKQDRMQDLKDFEHYTMIASPDLARSHLRRLLDSGISDEDLRELIDEAMTDERFNQVVSRARLVEGMGDIIGELEARARVGAMNLSRDPDRIQEAIQMLGGVRRQQQFARDVLLEAGEYSVPWLLKAITDGDDTTIKLKALDTLKEIGSPAVNPLSVALGKLDPQTQTRVASILGQIGNTAAGPYLSELANDSSAPEASREAARRAANMVSAGASDLSQQFGSLARRYLTQTGSLVNYPNEDTNAIWEYDSFGGLIPKPVPTEIFGDVMAMQLARKALQYNPDNANALATFIAGNLKRENDLPADMTDPVYGESDYSPAFYALGAGPDVMQQVLAMGLDMNDAPLIRDAIGALQKTSGGSNVINTDIGRSPLLEALQYSDRRVRYDAALALGKAMPRSNFDGDFSVVPTLAEAARAGATSYALVIADADEDRSTYASWLEAKGFEVVARVGTVGEAQTQVASTPGIDLVVIRRDSQGSRNAVSNLARSPKTSVAPVVVFTSQVEAQQLQRDFRDESRIQVKVAPREESAFGSIVDESLTRASGGQMSEGDALAYSLEAIGTLDDIARANSSVFNINDAESTLIEALQAQTGNLQVKIAGILAFVDSDRAQRALFDAALEPGDDQEQLLNQVAESAKRIGDRAEERHVQRLLALVQAGGPVGEAAARVHGALNLSSSNVVKIIAD